MPVKILNKLIKSSKNYNDIFLVHCTKNEEILNGKLHFLCNGPAIRVFCLIHNYQEKWWRISTPQILSWSNLKLECNCLSQNLWIYRSSRPEVFCRKGVLRNFAKFTGKHLWKSLFFNKVAGLRPLLLLTLLKRDSGQVFSCEFRETSKNTFFTEQLR